MVKHVKVLATIKQSFRLAFENPLAVLVFTIPIAIAMFLFHISLFIFSISPINQQTVFLSLILLISALWLGMLGAGGVTFYTREIYRQKRKIYLQNILKESFRNSIRLSIAYFLEQFILIIGFVLFIIPGIFLAIKLALVIPGCALEKKGFGIKRSWKATKGNFWRIFLILLIWNIIFIIISLIPYLSLLNIFLIPVYLITLTLLYLKLKK